MTDPINRQRGFESADESTFRGRGSSGFRIGGLSPILIGHRLTALAELIEDIGGRCWASGPTAAALHGFDGYPLQPPFHVSIERGRHVNRIGHVVHTTTSMPLIDRAEVEGIAVTSATRAIIDLARTESLERLTLAIDSATRDGSTSDDFLHRRLVAMRGSGRTGVGRLLAALEGIEITRGGHSWLERTFLVLLDAAGLPRPLTQQMMGKRRNKLIRVDCTFAGSPIVVELLGYSFHRTVLQMQSDAERMNRMVLDGRVPIQFTYLDVVERADAVVATVTEALAAHPSEVRVSA
jgi:hypothetical protein